MKRAFFQVALFASIIVLPSMTRADVHVFYDDAPEKTLDQNTGKSTSEENILYGRPGEDGFFIDFSDSRTLRIGDFDTEHFDDEGFDVRMSDRYHAVALKNLLREERIKCLPLYRGSHSEFFGIADTTGAQCRAKDVMNLINARAERYRLADEKKGIYEPDLKGVVDHTTHVLNSVGTHLAKDEMKVSQDVLKVLIGGPAALVGPAGRSKAAGAR